MTVSLDDVVFAFDCSRIEVSGGVRYLFDYSKNGYHMRFPGGAADPTPQLDGSLSFDGGDYLYFDGDLARFYARMPTLEHTWLIWYRQATDDLDYLFSCYDNGAGGTNDGLAVLRINGSGNLQAYQMQGGVGQPRVDMAAGAPTTRLVQTIITVEAAPRAIWGGLARTVAWAGGAFGTTTYDTAVVPRIGSNTNGANFLTGNFSYLALLRGALSSPDLSYASRLMAEGTNPWCVRR